MDRLRLDDTNGDDGKGKKPKPKQSAGGNYFEVPPALSFFSAGCTLLDCVLGGGWPLGRTGNIVGDKSTGKTLLAIEATANFATTFPNGRIRYREAEAAFDIPYAKALGMPVKRVEFGKGRLETVEQFHADLDDFAHKLPKGVPGMYVLDSLDALSDDAEMARDMDKKSFGTEKAKKMSELFRRLTRTVEKKKIFLLIISQVRDKIDAMFGRKTTRTGGRALDFYASQVIYLSHLGHINKERDKIKRTIGDKIAAYCDKNKVSLPFRKCEFPIIFGFGIDDALASVEWLKLIGRLKDAGISKSRSKKYLKRLAKMDSDEYAKERARLGVVVKQVWRDVEKTFLPKRRKYT